MRSVDIDSLKHFQRIAKIPANRDLLEIDAIVGPNNSGHRSIRAEQQRVNRQRNALAR